MRRTLILVALCLFIFGCEQGSQEYVYVSMYNTLSKITTWQRARVLHKDGIIWKISRNGQTYYLNTIEDVWLPSYDENNSPLFNNVTSGVIPARSKR